MLNKELQVEIDVLRRHGKGIREIARETGLARNTVRAMLRGEHRGQYERREQRPIKLEPFTALSARSHHACRCSAVTCDGAAARDP